MKIINHGFALCVGNHRPQHYDRLSVDDIFGLAVTEKMTNGEVDRRDDGVRDKQDESSIMLIPGTKEKQMRHTFIIKQDCWADPW